MDGDKGLELSLGLPCGGSSSNSKEKSDNSSSDVKADTDERTSKILNDFKNFLNAASISRPFQRVDSVKSHDNLFNTLSHTTSTGGNGPFSGDKRKNMFDEMSNQKKRETETPSSDIQDKGKASHISITTDEGSTAENEDVADSEAQGSTSRVVVSHCDDGGISGPHFPVRSTNNMNFPFSITIKESPSASAPSTSNTMHAIPFTKGECPMSFGYSPIQLPLLDKDRWTQVTNPNSPKAQTKQLVSKGSSSHYEDDNNVKPNNFPCEYPSIRPGVASNVKFGGSGSFPNLPWVSTTGPGPNGKTISGVTYKYNATQIKIVCACHGIHMSPDEFVQHATDDQSSGPTTPGSALIR